MVYGLLFSIHFVRKFFLFFKLNSKISVYFNRNIHWFSWMSPIFQRVLSIPSSFYLNSYYHCKMISKSEKLWKYSINGDVESKTLEKTEHFNFVNSNIKNLGRSHDFLWKTKSLIFIFTEAVRAVRGLCYNNTLTRSWIELKLSRHFWGGKSQFLR